MDKCRCCGNPLGEPFLDLGNSPISNDYISEVRTHTPEVYYPLEVYFCGNCSLVQIDAFQKPEQIFNEDYAYHSSYSQSWLKHCKAYTDMITSRFDVRSVLEIGSNDGYLLQYFKEKGIDVRGVEPSGCAEIAIEKGIPTDRCFFDVRYSPKVSPDLIIANNVLAHNPNINEFVEAISLVLAYKGIVTVEFPHLLNLLRENQFDTIYHEHYSYLSLNIVKFLFNKHGLDIFDVEELPTHGGSLRVYATHTKHAKMLLTANVGAILYKEFYAGMLKEETYRNFALQVQKQKRDILSALIEIKREGKTIVGYGAPAKGNTLLNYCGIRTDFLEHTVDKDPAKQYKYLPGTHIPILDPSRIAIDKPDYIFILPWNIKDEIIEQLSYARNWGAKFIVPIPKVMVVE